MGDEQIKCTVTFTSGSALVTGTGQSWLTALSNGHIICKDVASAPVYHIARAIDNNTLQLTANYAGDTETVAAVIHRSFTPIYRFARLFPGDHRGAEILTVGVIDKLEYWLHRAMPATTTTTTTTTTSSSSSTTTTTA